MAGCRLHPNEGIVQFVVVLQAIVDSGNSVISEAQSLSQYNTELARMELQTGTILETHGFVFFEERLASIGPLGRNGTEKCYPSATLPSGNTERYAPGDRPSEQTFNLEDPVQRADRSKEPDSNEPPNLEEKLDFKKIDQPSDKAMTDEEINEILKNRSGSRSLSDFLKNVF